MPSFGDYETVGEPVAITEERDHVTTVWQARKAGQKDSPPYSVKLFAPRRRVKSAGEQPGDVLDRDLALTFLEGIKQLIGIQRRGGNFLAPIHDFGVTPEGAWYATDFYPRSLKTWITLRGKVDGATLKHVVGSIVEGCLALKKERNYSHGNLKAGNVFLVGKPQALLVTPIHLADARFLELLEQSRQRSNAEKPSPETIELQDLRSLGELILQLVEGRLIATGYEYNYPIPRSAAWDGLGKEGEQWREICNRLLDSQLTLEKSNLESLGKQMKEADKPGRMAANMPVILAAAGAACLLAVVLYFVFRQKVPVILAQPQGATMEVRSNVVFSVTAVGRKLRYQWYKDGSGIADMTNSSLSMANLQTNDSGSYFVMVTNRAGGVSSKQVQFTVVTTLLRLTAHSLQRFYGEPNPPLTGDIMGMRDGDNMTVVCRTAANSRSPVGKYEIVPALVDSGNNLRNYLVITNQGTLTVNPARLTVTVSDAKRLYGDPDPEFKGEAKGLLADDGVTVTYFSLADSNSPAGFYDIMPTFKDSANRLNNYASVISKGKLTVLRAPLTVSVHNAQRVYGDNDPQMTGEIDGLRLGDSLAVGCFSPAKSNSPVGNYPIFPKLDDPTGRFGNYDATTNPGTLAIIKAPLRVAAQNKTRIYGGANPQLNGELSGLRAGDSIAATFATAARNDSVTGTYDILPVFQDPGGRLGNYDVSTNKGTLVVTVAPLKVQAHDATRIYGEPNPHFTGELTGARPGDDISVTFDTVARGDTVVGSYDILPVFSDPHGKLQNYVITTNKGTLTITPAALTVTANNNTHAYGEGNPKLTGGLSGVRPGDDLIAVFYTSARSDTAVGAYDILPVFMDPAHRLSNYLVTTNKGTLSITLTHLTITADNKKRIYGENNPPFTGELSGLRPGDGIVPVFDSAARVDSSIGSYEIIPSFKDPANRLPNYIVVTNKGVLTIFPATLTATAHDQKRPYGKDNPPFTGEVNGLRKPDGIRGIFGMSPRGDNISVTYRVSADANTPVGTYDVSPVFNDPDNRLKNYVIVTNLGRLTITPARLTVKVHNLKRAQGENNPPFSGEVSGLRPGDNITITYQTAADNTSAAGHYSIEPRFQDPDNKLVNYMVLTNNAGILTITPPIR